RRRSHDARADREHPEDGGGARRRPAHDAGHLRAAETRWQAAARQALMTEPFPYDAWSALLADVVTAEGKVDYSRLAERRDLLQRFVGELGVASPESQPARF